MSDLEHSPASSFPDVEHIMRETGFTLRGSYSREVFEVPVGKRSYHEHFRALREILGEEKVIMSFYLSPEGELRWGIFTQEGPAASPPAAEQARLAVQETVEMPVIS